MIEPFRRHTGVLEKWKTIIFPSQKNVLLYAPSRERFKSNAEIQNLRLVLAFAFCLPLRLRLKITRTVASLCLMLIIVMLISKRLIDFEIAIAIRSS